MLVHIWRLILLLLGLYMPNLPSPTMHTPTFLMLPVLLLLRLFLCHLFISSANSFSQELLWMSEQFLESLTFGRHELAMASFAKPLCALGTG